MKILNRTGYSDLILLTKVEAFHTKNQYESHRIKRLFSLNFSSFCIPAKKTWQQVSHLYYNYYLFQRPVSWKEYWTHELYMELLVQTKNRA